MVELAAAEVKCELERVGCTVRTRKRLAVLQIQTGLKIQSSL